MRRPSVVYGGEKGGRKGERTATEQKLSMQVHPSTQRQQQLLHIILDVIQYPNAPAGK